MTTTTPQTNQPFPLEQANLIHSTTEQFRLVVESKRTDNLEAHFDNMKKLLAEAHGNLVPAAKDAHQAKNLLRRMDNNLDAMHWYEDKWEHDGNDSSHDMLLRHTNKLSANAQKFTELF